MTTPFVTEEPTRPGSASGETALLGRVDHGDGLPPAAKARPISFSRSDGA